MLPRHGFWLIDRAEIGFLFGAKAYFQVTSSHYSNRLKMIEQGCAKIDDSSHRKTNGSGHMTESGQTMDQVVKCSWDYTTLY